MVIQMHAARVDLNHIYRTIVIVCNRRVAVSTISTSVFEAYRSSEES